MYLATSFNFCEEFWSGKKKKNMEIRQAALRLYIYLSWNGTNLVKESARRVESYVAEVTYLQKKTIPKEDATH